MDELIYQTWSSFLSFLFSSEFINVLKAVAKWLKKEKQETALAQAQRYSLELDFLYKQVRENVFKSLPSNLITDLLSFLHLILILLRILTLNIVVQPNFYR